MAYEPVILTTPGYEKLVRSKLGAKENEIPNDDINQDLIIGIAEAAVIKKVPDFAVITSEMDKLYLKNAAIAYICYLLAPSMSRRVNIEVHTIDVKWKKDKVDWEQRAQEFISEFNDSLANISSVEVVGYDCTLFRIVPLFKEG